MDDKLISVFVGIVAGAVGYWVTTFWMKPILRYRELRSKVLSDLIYFAQVINADGLNADGLNADGANSAPKRTRSWGEESVW